MARSKTRTTLSMDDAMTQRPSCEKVKLFIGPTQPQSSRTIRREGTSSTLMQRSSHDSASRDEDGEYRNVRADVPGNVIRCSTSPVVKDQKIRVPSRAADTTVWLRLSITIPVIEALCPLRAARIPSAASGLV